MKKYVKINHRLFASVNELAITFCNYEFSDKTDEDEFITMMLKYYDSIESEITREVTRLNEIEEKHKNLKRPRLFEITYKKYYKGKCIEFNTSYNNICNHINTLNEKKHSAYNKWYMLTHFLMDKGYHEVNSCDIGHIREYWESEEE